MRYEVLTETLLGLLGIVLVWSTVEIIFYIRYKFPDFCIQSSIGNITINDVINYDPKYKKDKSKECEEFEKRQGKILKVLFVTEIIALSIYLIVCIISLV